VKLESGVLAGGVQRIALEGRLDIDGVQAIDVRFTALTATGKANFVLDLAGVTLLASIGIRLLVTAARAQRARGGKIAIACAQPAVRASLVSAGIDHVIPLFDDVESARASFAGT
jgi:anti-anti-sigma factor